MPQLGEVFAKFEEQLGREQATREKIKVVVKEIESVSREIAMTLQVMHSDHPESAVLSACLRSRELFQDVRDKYGRLADSFPEEDYYKYRDHWKNVTQKLCFAAALIVWLEVGMLISRETAAEILGIHPKETEQNKKFHLDIEDFLMGILELCSELSRYCINCVTRGDCVRPLQISQFVSEVNSGFRLLNLKNDGLRKRFDCLKYDVKKIEEVIYDLSIRGMIPQKEGSST